MIEVFHVIELNTSYIKMLELLQLDLTNQSSGLMELEQTTTKPIAWTLIYDTITTNFEGKTIMIYVFHVNELNTSYIKMLELLELDLPNQSYG